MEETVDLFLLNRMTVDKIFVAGARTSAKKGQGPCHGDLITIFISGRAGLLVSIVKDQRNHRFGHATGSSLVDKLLKCPGSHRSRRNAHDEADGIKDVRFP